MKKALLITMVLGIASLSAQAVVTIDVRAGWIYGDNGTTHLPTESLVAFICDVEGDGFGDWENNTLGPDGFTIDDDDVLLATNDSGPNADGLLWNVYDLADGYAGKEFGFVWFNTPYDPAATGGGENVNYGFYTGHDTVPSGTLDYAYFTDDANGDVPAADLYAPYTTTPEPASMLLLLAGGGLMAARRRRKTA